MLNARDKISKVIGAVKEHRIAGGVESSDAETAGEHPPPVVRRKMKIAL